MMIDLTDALQKKLGSLGHHLACFDEALRILQRRLIKGRLPRSWIEYLGSLDICPEVDEFPDELIVGLANGDMAPQNGGVIDLPAAPWLISTKAKALLHLPAARSIWQQMLRRSVLEDLVGRLPRAWIVDLTPLPPSAAIAGLGISSWGQLPRLQSSGQILQLDFSDADPLVLGPETELELWRAGANRLIKPSSRAFTVSQVTVEKPSLVARYQRCQGRWEMTSASGT